MIDLNYSNDPEIAKIEAGLKRDYELGSPNSARAYQEAEDDGLVVVLPTDTQLQLDIDDNRAYAIYTALVPVVDRYYTVLSVLDEPSRSGLPKRHITLTLARPVGVFERIAIQACMGSDRVRELLGVIQAMQGDPHPTLFLEKKPNVCTVAVDELDGNGREIE